MIDVLVPKFDPLNPRSAVENMMLMTDSVKDSIYHYYVDDHAKEFYAYLHDDVEIQDHNWESSVRNFFGAYPRVGMIGFGGALGLGTPELYKRPYDYRQLARVNFYSNMEDAEHHGYRALKPMRVAVLDGFAQIIRREAYEDVGGWKAVLNLGIEYHMYDAAMACLMAEHGWEVWMLPIACRHRGGITSTSRPYLQWLESRGIKGDDEIHKKAHVVIYNRFRNILPLRR